MHFIRGTILTIFIVISFIALSAVYIYGLNGTFKLLNTYYLKTSPSSAPKLIQSTKEQFKNIDEEVAKLLQEIQKEAEKINFDTINFLPKLTQATLLPTLEATLVSFFDSTIIYQAAIESNSTQNSDIKNKIFVQDVKTTVDKNSSTLLVKVNISSQRMNVYKNGKLLYRWKISTGRKGYATPTGRWKPKYLVKMHYSRKYHNSPMPYSIFFYKGVACHGTKSVWRLGRRASHGCVRLKTSNAKKLYYLVSNVGRENSTIEVHY
jgi:lipoprotein-anchoring transpeptidase ErfK/SrfK